MVSEFISLDGVIEDPGGAEGEWGWTDFPHSGWTFDFDRVAAGDAVKADELKAADAQLLGRITYEGFAKAWPPMRTEAGDFGEKMNAMPKYVVSTTMSDEHASWENSTVIREDLPAAVARLKNDVDGEILVQGSATLARSLAGHGLVDQYRLMLFPVALGTGKRLFEGGPKTKPRVVDKQAGGSGRHRHHDLRTGPLMWRRGRPDRASAACVDTVREAAKLRRSSSAYDVMTDAATRPCATARYCSG